MKKFSSKKDVVEFEIDDDMFRAHGVVPADYMAQLADRFEESDNLSTEREKYEALRGITADLLLDDSKPLLIARCGDWSNPISMEALTELIKWRMEELSGRPTQPPSPSTPPPPSDGPTSTDGQSVEPSLSPASTGVTT